MDVGGFMFSHMRGEFSVAVFTTPAMIILGSALLVSIPPGLRAARIAPTKAMGAH
jgi:ABC-type lipoprotein release transport system permease subunit